MPWAVHRVVYIVCAAVCTDGTIDTSIVFDSIYAHGHVGPYARPADSTDASSDDGTAVSLDARGGHNFDTFIAPSPAPP